ncbi:hypothetical protein [Pseudoalteromonas luteoviolacea]|uniref:Uncharacterized protein n=1 Tax=Pseudoalteromonas luteoviolacea (strain 2ta16) TaxID=1353533 RepID=V4JBW2_PSEL2|nr:hypothetical protein [Pseudoalteromonas luteoviolacea]ESP92622.1 hypothetical protein PL2TA16_03820 [Pseudoalteromonas luteoviolacea 2ta16]KZN35430.1 hypothetical protein N483_00330 [Pseudoalteromonas luteoviolacea NCIMB 1944]
MAFKSLVLSLITSLSLLAFSYLSNLLGHGGIGFILLAVLLFTLSIFSVLKSSPNKAQKSQSTSHSSRLAEVK